MGRIQGNNKTIRAIAMMMIIAVYWENSNEMAEIFEFTWGNALVIVALVTLSMLNASKIRKFLYFNFR